MKKITTLLALMTLFAVVVPDINTTFLCATDYSAILQEELDEFKLMYYTEKTMFPLENLVTLDDKPFDPATVRGKYILLNLWTTWCPYCGKEKPSIQVLYNTYGAEDFTVLTIALGEEIKAVQEYMDTNGYHFPVVINKDVAFKTTYAPKIPATYILDKEGYILSKINGNKDWSDEQTLKILAHILPVFNGER